MGTYTSSHTGSEIDEAVDKTSVIRFSVFSQGVAPTVLADSNSGFEIGSLWVMNDGTEYICTDPSLGAAVWVEQATKTYVDNAIATVNPSLYLQKNANLADVDDPAASATNLNLGTGDDVTHNSLALSGNLALSGSFAAPVAFVPLPTTGTSTAFVLTPSPALAAYVVGQVLTANLHTSAGPNPTLNVSGLGAKSIRVNYGGSLSAPASGTLSGGRNIQVAYDGTYFVVLGQQWAPPGDTTSYGLMMDPANVALAIAASSSLPAVVILTSGTWVKPSYPASTNVKIEVWGGGGGGWIGSTTDFGGGGGGYNTLTVLLSDLGATETVTIGAGGPPTNGAGGDGGTTSFGAWCSAYGGGSAAAGSFTSQGGGPFGKGAAGGGTAAASTTPMPASSYSGGAGAFANARNGGNALNGGGGGSSGTSGYTGGVSLNGGNGGSPTGSAGGNGAVPGGGGSGGTSTAGTGGNGQVKITYF